MTAKYIRLTDLLHEAGKLAGELDASSPLRRSRKALLLKAIRYAKNKLVSWYVAPGEPLCGECDVPMKPHLTSPSTNARSAGRPRDREKRGYLQ